jgi:hypothetical protein
MNIISYYRSLPNLDSYNSSISGQKFNYWLDRKQKYFSFDFRKKSSKQKKLKESVQKREACLIFKVNQCCLYHHHEDKALSKKMLEFIRFEMEKGRSK